MRCSCLVGLMLVASGMAASTGAAQSYSFTLLDSVVPGTTFPAVPYSISGNGQVIAGGDLRYRDGEQPFVWRKVEGEWVRSQLPVPPAGTWLPQDRGRGTSLSFDGDVIGGMAGNTTESFSVNYGMAAVWTDVLSGQPQLQMISTDIQGRAACGGVSADGTKVVWTSALNANSQVSVWEEGVSTRLAPVPGGALSGASAFGFFGPHLTSGDGSLVGLNGNSGFSTTYAFVWDQGTIRALEVRPDLSISQIGGSGRRVDAISLDGETIVGNGISDSTSGATSRAVTWTRSGTLSILPRLPAAAIPNGSQWTYATDVSADGRVIVGSQYTFFPWPGARSQLNFGSAIVWVSRVPRTLTSILTQQGVSLGTVVPVIITGVSDDGTTMTGVGIASNSFDSPIVSFVATILPPGVCDDIDFNRDGNRFDPVDIDAFLSRYSEGPCLPAGASCRDIDFNNDGAFFDPEDIDAFLRVFGEGPCVD